MSLAAVFFTRQKKIYHLNRSPVTNQHLTRENEKNLLTVHSKKAHLYLEFKPFKSQGTTLTITSIKSLMLSTKFNNRILNELKEHCLASPVNSTLLCLKSQLPSVSVICHRHSGDHRVLCKLMSTGELQYCQLYSRSP